MSVNTPSPTAAPPEDDDVWGEMGNPKDDDCARCGAPGTDAADGDGARICADCGAALQRRGNPNVSWDGDAPQSSQLTRHDPEGDREADADED
jgi:hypothetical protein